MARGLLIAFLLSFGPIVANSFARFAYALVLPAMRGDLGWTWAQAGWLNTASSAGYLAGAVLVRLLVVRVGNRALFQAGMVLTALAILATGLTRDFDLLSLTRFVAGVCSASVFICGGALAANVLPSRPELATTFIGVFFGASGVGLILSGVGIPLLLEARGDASWPVVWVAMGAASLAMAVGSAWAASRTPEPGSAQGDAQWRLAPFVAHLLGYLMFAVGYIGYMTFVIAWMRDLGASTAGVIAMWSTLGLATVLAPFLWRGPFDRWRGGRPMAAALGCLSAGALIPLLTAEPAWMLASAALFGVGMFSVPSSVTVLIKHGLPKPAWGSAMATFTIVFGFGQVIGPIGTGWLADLTGSLRPGLSASVAVLLAGALIALLQKDPREARR
ncbi:MAG TPA: YbfB/YjiJ family MFS transporter [Quisquiliibacterium sp.]|nr:YbfB/YjiJ family MFS transporter [Quisquiliibacterium sp.]